MSLPINFVQIISKKRDRLELSRSEIFELVNGYTKGTIPDYQMSAFAMAVLLNGMTFEETVALTDAMLCSGETLNWPGESTQPQSTPIVDKHSTGGIGDKISIHLAPMLACCGVKVPMISGRGLGPTGGTLDKLESIPGFRTDLTISEIQAQVNSIGCVITGASPQIAPADRKLYALRDVTGTVESIPLITASILSKKIAAGLNALVLDVKFGSGAFMQSIEQASKLAESIVAVGNALGVKTTALITDMNQTLGVSAGNAIEVQESIELLQGQSPPDLMAVTLELGANLLHSADGQVLDFHRNQLLNSIQSGQALKKFNEMVSAQGGSSFQFEPVTVYSVLAKANGFISAIDARTIGFAVIELGGGRKKLGDVLDLEVGIRQVKRLGSEVKKGDTMFDIVSAQPLNHSHANQAKPTQAKLTQAKLKAAIELLEQSYTISPTPSEPRTLIEKVVS